MSQEEINAELNKKETLLNERQEAAKLSNLKLPTNESNLKLNECLEPGELSFLIQPEKQTLKSRVVPIFGDQSKTKISPKKGESSKKLLNSSTKVGEHESSTADKMVVG